MTTRHFIVICCLGLSLFAAGCGAGDSLTPTRIMVVTASIVPTATATATTTRTPRPSHTPAPTATPSATATPTPLPEISLSNVHALTPLTLPISVADPIYQVALSADNSMLAMLGSDSISFFDPSTGESAVPIIMVTSAFDRNGVPGVLELSPDGSVVALGLRHQSVDTWDVTSGQALQSYSVQAWGGVYAFDPTSKFLAISNGPPASSQSSPHIITIWKLMDNKVFIQLDFPSITGVVEGLAYSDDGKFLAAGSQTSDIAVWSLPDYKIATHFYGSPRAPRHVAFAPSDPLLATGHDNGEVILWDMAKLAQSKVLSVDQASAVAQIAFSPNGQILVSEDQRGVITVWDVGSGQLLETLAEQSSGTGSVTVTPDGCLILFVSAGNTLSAWGIGAP